ncbi:MAG: isopenicillin N synthase family dioxygenase [Desertimonas sp.]
MELPLVDVAPLLDDDPDHRTLAARRDVARRLDQACRRFGVVRVSGHGVPAAERVELERLSRAFFDLPTSDKSEIAMTRAGASWRGWCPVGAELTSGRPDHREGIYFGTEATADDARVIAGTPLHGPNLFPPAPGGLAAAVHGWMRRMELLGQRTLAALGAALVIGEEWFATHVTTRPTTLFRIFRHLPERDDDADDGRAAPQHIDHGLLTLLAQEPGGGLEVQGPRGWIDVPADFDELVVIVGGLLERMTKGLYRAAPHRVRNRTDHGRLSFPFFLDPDWDATATALPAPELDATDVSAGPPRWDGADVRAWDGPYGDALTAKVARAFPALFVAATSRVSGR